MESAKKSYDLWLDPGKNYSAESGQSVANGHHASAEEEISPVQSNKHQEREQWGSKAEFVLSCIGLSVGLGNVWRFPYLAFENGGAAFLIAYIILQLLIGKPLYFMELVMGQYSSKGPTRIWDMNPAARGIGFAQCLISLVVAIYYNVIMAYTLFFMFSSMQRTVPWMKCKDEWENCIAERTGPPPEPCRENQTWNMLVQECECTGNDTIDLFNCTPKYTSATQLYFYKEVIERSSGIDPEHFGGPLWRLALCLLLAWMVVVFCLIKGIKSSGKVVYFTATFPYVILLILLVRGAFLDGALEGVKFFIVPKWEKLADIKVWAAAAGQMFFSLAVSFGGIIMYGSYNKFTNKVYGDALLVSTMDLVTSIIAGFVVFTTFGGMAKTINAPIEQVAQGGYGMAFVAYPEALTKLPPVQLWSILFFFMLFTLGLDSEFALLETIMTCLQDEVPRLRRYKTPMCIGLGISCYFLALPCICNGGDYVVTILDMFGGDSSVLVVSCLESASIMWVYGVRRFMGDVEYMLGKKPQPWPYWIFCWVLCAPILIGLLFMYRMIKFDPPTYANGQPFPDLAVGFGWALLAFVLCPIPLWFFYHVIRTIVKYKNHLTSLQIIIKIFKPTSDWGPNDGGRRKMMEESRYSMTDTKNGVVNYGLQVD